MRFVSKKRAETRALVMTHKARELLVRQLTQIINALRAQAHLGASGIVAPKGVPRVGRLLETGARAALPECARLPLRLLADQFFATRDRIDMRTKESCACHSRRGMARQRGGPRLCSPPTEVREKDVED
jgi:transposase